MLHQGINFLSCSTLYCTSVPSADFKSFFIVIWPLSLILKYAGALSSPTIINLSVLNGGVVSSSIASTANICAPVSVFSVKGRVAGKLEYFGRYLFLTTPTLTVALV